MEALVSPAGIRAEVERALIAEQVDLTTEPGRGRAEQLIEETIAGARAGVLAAGGSTAVIDELVRELRDDLVGLGAIAEAMLADPEAQEWMVNGPRRIFRDSGERIERVTGISFADDRQLRAFLERLLEQVEGKRLDRLTPTDRGPTPRRLAAHRGDPAGLLQRPSDLLDPPLPARRELARANSSSSASSASRRRPFLAACVRAGTQHRRLRPRLLRQDDAAQRARARDPGPGARRRLRILRRAATAAPARELHRLRGSARKRLDGLPRSPSKTSSPTRCA